MTGGVLPGCCDVLTTLPVAGSDVRAAIEEYGRYRRAHWLALGRPPAEVLACRAPEVVDGTTP